jgi:hypothetical protein
MLQRLRPWQMAVAAVVLCAGVLAIVHFRSQRTYDAAALLATLPPDHATHIFISVTALRDSGILDMLAGSKAEEEPDYQHFVEQTGFDYRTDMEAVAGAFFGGGSYFAVRGHFDWKKLNAYAKAQNGACRNAVCTMPASEPGRFISFEPLAQNVLALAFGTEERGVVLISPDQWKTRAVVPPDPIWISAPSFAFSDPKGFPAGAQSFLSPLAQAQQVVFRVGPEGQRFQIRLDVTCASPQEATAIAQKLTSTTDLLKAMLERDKMTPNPDDLSGVLVSGTFAQQNNTVTGAWPISRGFISGLVSGRIQ